MIPKIIHQVFLGFDKDNLQEIPIFKECQAKTIEFCKQHGYQYMLHNLSKSVKLFFKDPIYEEYIDLWKAFKLPIMRADFIRYLILHYYGGIYIDLDMYPLKCFDPLLNRSEVFCRWADDSKKLPYNAFMMSEPKNRLFLEIMEHCKLSYYEKAKKEIYKQWVGRFVFQTTGHYMLQRILKPRGIIPENILKINNKKGKIVSAEHPYVEDYNASIWYQ